MKKDLLVNKKNVVFHSERALFLLILLSALLGGALVGALAVASKLVQFFGLTASVTFLAYAFSFTITDIVAELYGKKIATRVVLSGFVAVVVGMLMFQLATIIPGAVFWQNTEGFNLVFATSWRIALAGILSYLVAQLIDVHIFHNIKERTQGKHLWLRNNASTAVSQFIDTLIFITIGFGFMMHMVAGQYLLKLGIALIDTVIVYAVVLFVRKRS